MRPASLAEVAKRTAADPDWPHHLDEFLDTFYGADGDVSRQSEMIADAPGLLGRPETDAFIGGAGEHLARRWGLDIPAWVHEPERYLATPMFYPDRAGFRSYLRAVSPVAFRTRLIYTGPDPLQRARFPYQKKGVVRPKATRVAQVATAR